MSNCRLSWLPLAAIVQGASMVLPGAAAAQLFFDWGGQEKVNDSGRQLVRINADARPGEIIVSFTDRKLYLITAPGQALSYPVAIPREQDRWQGVTTVTQKRENPSWTPTPSMLKENPRLPRWVPGGHPMNPLGNRALYLGSSFYRIHGTDAPWTIGTAVSKGCIRMYNNDALDVYERTRVGSRVLVTWAAYQTSAESEQAEQQLQQQDAGAASGGRNRSRNGDRVQPVPAAAVAVPPPAATPPAPPRKTESRYSDIFGTPEPTSPAPAVTSAEPPPAPPAAAQPPRQTRTREGQQQREPRKGRETAQEPSERATAATTTPPPQTPDAAPAPSGTPRPAAARTTEPRQRAAPIETGAVPDRRVAPKAAATPAAPPVVTYDSTLTSESVQPAPAQRAPAEAPRPAPPAAADIAAKALEAAERAAAAAERAAAAAERAERAAAARAAPAAAPPAPAPASDPPPARSAPATTETATDSN